ncbi:hypothetical protein ACIA98_01990 [Streptomyces sp. NPDC051366]|uniref:hypothetical protein n=1 Tax=Streptomyces sp. NPDC051366 TaxID=3365652 RepID=UPI00379F78EE
MGQHVTYTDLHTERTQASIGSILCTAIHDGKRGFTLAYFRRAEELADKMRDAGLVDVQVFGIEGPVWSALKAVEQRLKAVGVLGPASSRNRHLMGSPRCG